MSTIDFRTPAKRRSSVNPGSIASRLGAQSGLWQPLPQFDPTTRYYTRLAAEHEYEAWLLTWLPGQGTQWHDHGGSAGAFLTLQGALTEEIAAVRPDDAPKIVPGARELTAGSLRPFGSRHIHRVTNRGNVAAVSLHVYAPSLAEMNNYQPVEGSLRLETSQLAGVSW